MKTTVFVLILASFACSKPVFTEPRSMDRMRGMRIVSDGEYGYATGTNTVARLVRTSEGIVLTDSARVPSIYMTESSQYIPRDSLHGYIAGWQSVCAVDWSVKPAKVSDCVGGLSLDGSTGGLTQWGATLVLCGGGICYSFDTRNDTIQLVDSLRFGGWVGCKTSLNSESFLLRVDSNMHMPDQVSRLMRCDVGLKGCVVSRTIDNYRLSTFNHYISPDNAAQDLKLDSSGRMALWDAIPSSNRPIDKFPAGLGYTNLMYGYDDSVVVFSWDSSLAMTSWDRNTGNSVGTTTIVSLGANSIAWYHLSYEKKTVWNLTENGIISFRVAESSGPPASVVAGGAAKGPIRISGRSLEMVPASSGMVRILSADGRVEAVFAVRAGESIRWTAPGRGLRFVESGTTVEKLMIP